jgi:hypothetical protein
MSRVTRSKEESRSHSLPRWVPERMKPSLTMTTSRCAGTDSPSPMASSCTFARTHRRHVKRLLSQCVKRFVPLWDELIFAELLHHVARRSLAAQMFE